jgi:hypothetical protein
MCLSIYMNACIYYDVQSHCAAFRRYQNFCRSATVAGNGLVIVIVFTLVLSSANSDHQVVQLPHPRWYLYGPRSSPLYSAPVPALGPFTQKRGVATRLVAQPAALVQPCLSFLNASTFCPILSNNPSCAGNTAHSPDNLCPLQLAV